MKSKECPSCGSYVLTEQHGLKETETCYYCGWQYTIDLSNGKTREQFNAGVMHIIYEKGGQIFVCKNKEEKERYARWIAEGFFDKPIVKAYFTFSLGHSLMQENVI